MKRGSRFAIALCVIGILVFLGLGAILVIDSGMIPGLGPIIPESLYVRNDDDTLNSGDSVLASDPATTSDTVPDRLAPASASGQTDAQTAAALAAAAAANSKIAEHQLIFVGDSRTLGMRNAESDLDDTCIYIGAEGEGFAWFKKEGFKQMAQAIIEHPDAPVILNLGVNDTEEITNYLDLYSTLSASFQGTGFYFMSVNPVTDESEHVTNMEISEFNKAIREAFPDQYLDCNTYLMVREFETVDGIHFTEDTYCAIHDYAVKQIIG